MSGSLAVASLRFQNTPTEIEDSLATIFSFFIDTNDSEKNMQFFIELRKVCKGWNRVASSFCFLLKHAQLLNFRQSGYLKLRFSKCIRAHLIQRSLRAYSLPFSLEYQLNRHMVLLYVNVFLSVKDIFACRLVSRGWKRAATDWSLISSARKEALIANKKKHRLIDERARTVGEAAIAAVDNRVRAIQDRYNFMIKIQNYLTRTGGLRQMIGKPCHTYPGSPRVARLRLTNLSKIRED